MGNLHLTCVGEHFKVADFLQTVDWPTIQAWEHGDHHIASNRYSHSGFNLCIVEEESELESLCQLALEFIQSHSQAIMSLQNFSAERTTLLLHCPSKRGKALSLSAQFLAVLGNHNINLALVPQD